MAVVIIIQILAGLFALLPLPVALALGRGLGWIYGSVVRYHRREALEALAQAFPEKSSGERLSILREMYVHTGMNLAECARMLGGRAGEIARLVEVQGQEHLEAALARDKGVLALTSHLGNWEYLAARLAGLHQPAGLVIKELKHSRLNRFLIRAREKRGLRVFERRGASRPILKGLRKENLLLGFVLDQNMMWKEGVFVDFFGRPACTSPGLAQMAAMTGAPVLPIEAERLPGGRHRVTIHPPLDPPSGSDPETIREHTQRYTFLLEQFIRRIPGQWIWMHRRWRTTPDKIGTP